MFGRQLWSAHDHEHNRGVMERITDIGTLLLEAQRAVARDLGDALVERGYEDVRPSHAALFLFVDRRGGTRLGELARRAGVTKQSMMQVVDDLEALGYVRREPDPADARAKLVHLTAHGRRCATEFRRAVQVLETRTRRRLGDRGYEAVRSALTKLVERP
jgi:DNA-binding MarR family transcriptional regulator